MVEAEGSVWSAKEVNWRCTQEAAKTAAYPKIFLRGLIAECAHVHISGRISVWRSPPVFTVSWWSAIFDMDIPGPAALGSHLRY